MGHVMTDRKRSEFYQRLDRLEDKERNLTKGYVITVNQDGLIVAKPKRNRPRFPWFGLLAVAAFLVFFKATLILVIGEASYSDRVSRLSDGNFLEKTGAFVMQVDPVAKLIADQINTYFN